MHSIELTFECYRDTTLSAVEPAIVNYLDALRYHGQIIGREFPTAMRDGCFVSRVVCPEPDSLHPDNHSEQVRLAEQQLHAAGLLTPKVHDVGVDLLSDATDPCVGEAAVRPRALVLYTSFLHTCSPVRCLDHFAPVPLYRLPAVANGDHKQIIKWQEDWEACDQLQMNGSIAEHVALFELGDVSSRLYRRGTDLCKRLRALTGIPTYYYLYRVGGESLASEQARLCPSCGGPWALAAPLQQVFDFKCDACGLLSNISWDFKP
ncbi:MAG: Zn-ribbon-containing protein [Aeromonas sp.]